MPVFVFVITSCTREQVDAALISSMIANAWQSLLLTLSRMHIVCGLGQGPKRLKRRRTALEPRDHCEESRSFVPTGSKAREARDTKTSAYSHACNAADHHRWLPVCQPLFSSPRL